MIGALVTLRTTKGTQLHPIVTGDSFLSQDAYTAHFGLGSQTTVEQVTVRWPEGDVSSFHEPDIDRVHVVDAKAR